MKLDASALAAFFLKEKGAVNVILRLTVNDAEEALHGAIVVVATVRDKLQVSIEGFRVAMFFDPFGYIRAITERSHGHWNDAEHRPQRRAS